MKKPRRLDPKAERAIMEMRTLREHFVGDIVPSYMFGAFAKGEGRRTYADAIRPMVLSHIVNQYRVPEKSDPWWNDQLYRLNRTELAKRFYTEPDVISACISSLRRDGFIECR